MSGAPQSEQKSIFDFNANNWQVSKVDGKIHNICNLGVEPKYHEGDWIIATDDEGNITIEKIIEFWGDKVRLVDTDGYYTLWPQHELNYYHLWTLGDVKDGDVLVYNNSSVEIILLFKKWINGVGDGAYSYAHTFNNEILFNDWSDCGYTAHPATKEQRDLLFKKIHDAGWEWNDKKKKLRKLEKQVEQNPIDNVEPKFQQGQRIVWQDKCYKVNHNGCGYELIDQNGLSTSLEYETVDESAHLWTIKDAKSGDVLASKDGDEILIFRNLDSNTSFSSYYNIKGKGEIGWSNRSFIPATKEQRDQLEKAMADAGYTFDFEKKELKEIEEEYDGEDYGIDSLFHAQRILEKTLGKVDGYQTDDGILSHKCAISAVKKLYEQKPAEWSDEDEYIIEEIEAIIDAYVLEEYDPKALKNWLKSIKDRVQPQSQPAWSEEDEHRLEDTIYFLDTAKKHYASADELDACIDWLESLKQRMEEQK